MRASEPQDRHDAGAPQALTSWKAIASYLKRDITTVQRWERREGMPVHRHVHDKRGSVYAYPSELDAWRKERSATPERQSDPPAPDAARRPLLWIAAAVALVVAAGLIWWAARSPGPSTPLANARINPLTDFEGVETAAAISRDGRFVAFLSDRDGQIDVWVTETGSGRFRNLTQGAVHELANPEVRALAFTPDGASITLWSRGADGAVNVLAAPVAGGALHTYVAGGVELDWSSDGARMVYHTTAPGDPTFLREGDASVRALFSGPVGVHNHFQTWSPDDRYIYFVRGAPPDESDLWRFKLDGGTLERITHHDSRVLYPTFVDTNTLLYLATAEDGSGPWLYALDVIRNATQRISFGLEQYTSLATAADRQRLAVTVEHSRSSLWQVPLRDGVIEQELAARIADRAVGPLSPRIMQDSLVYVTPKGDGHALWRYEDGVAHELWNAPRTRILGAPAVGPNGSTLAFTAESDRGTALYLLEPGRSPPQVAAPSLDVRGAPAWAPDGKSLVVTARTQTGHQLMHVPLDSTQPATTIANEHALNPQWAPDGSFVLYAAREAGPDFVLKAVTLEGAPYPLPPIRLSRTARRVAFIPGERALLALQGGMSRLQFWRIDLDTGERRQLSNFAGEFGIRDFDVTADGRAVVFDRREENSDIALIELAAK